MSRAGWSNSNFLRYGGGVVTAPPLTMACWANTSVTGSAQALMSLVNSAASADRNQFRLMVAAANNVRARCGDGAGSSDATASATIPTSTWFHAAAVFASSTSRAAYQDGANKGTNATSRVPSGIDRTSIGKEDNASSGFAWANGGTGYIAHAAIWDIALSDAEVAALATPGTLPTDIQPAHLVAYWPLVGSASPEPDIVGGFDMTIQGTLSQAGDPWKNVLLTGAATAALCGSIGISALTTLTGVAATMGVGSITPAVLVSILGVQGTAALGALIADTALRINLAGVQATAAVGTLTPAIGISLAGVGAVCEAGPLTLEVALALMGIEARAEAGTFTITDSWSQIATSIGGWTEAHPASGGWSEAPRASGTWTEAK